MIVIVNDDDIFLRSLSDRLKLNLYSVKAYKQAVRAIEYCRANAHLITCVVLDLLMPPLKKIIPHTCTSLTSYTGYLVYRLIRSFNTDIPIIIYSGLAVAMVYIPIPHDDKLCAIQMPSTKLTDIIEYFKLEHSNYDEVDSQPSGSPLDSHCQLLSAKKHFITTEDGTVKWLPPEGMERERCIHEREYYLGGLITYLKIEACLLASSEDLEDILLHIGLLKEQFDSEQPDKIEISSMVAFINKKIPTAKQAMKQSTITAEHDDVGLELVEAIKLGLGLVI